MKASPSDTAGSDEELQECGAKDGLCGTGLETAEEDCNVCLESACCPVIVRTQRSTA